MTGRALDWNADGIPNLAEEAVLLGQGVPSAPSITVGIGSGGATPTLTIGASDSGQSSRQMEALTTDIATEIVHFPVSREWCELLH